MNKTTGNHVADGMLETETKNKICTDCKGEGRTLIASLNEHIEYGGTPDDYEMEYELCTPCDGTGEIVPDYFENE